MSSDPFLEGCWRCAAPGVKEDADGRRLCSNCRLTVLGVGPAYYAMSVGGIGGWWDALALERCWRCTSGVVEKSDDLGLCDECKEQLVDVTDS